MKNRKLISFIIVLSLLVTPIFSTILLADTIENTEQDEELILDEDQEDEDQDIDLEELKEELSEIREETNEIIAELKDGPDNSKRRELMKESRELVKQRNELMNKLNRYRKMIKKQNKFKSQELNSIFNMESKVGNFEFDESDLEEDNFNNVLTFIKLKNDNLKEGFKFINRINAEKDKKALLEIKDDFEEYKDDMSDEIDEIKDYLEESSDIKEKKVIISELRKFYLNQRKFQEQLSRSNNNLLKKELQQMRKMANELVKAGNIDEAEELYEDILDISEDKESDYKEIGKILTKVEKDRLKIFVKNKRQDFDAEPYIEEGRTLVPVASISRALGASIKWNNDTRTVTISKGEKEIVLPIDEKEMNVNGKLVKVDVPARIKQGRTFVPLKFVSENLDTDVDWDGETRMITINKKDLFDEQEDENLIDEIENTDKNE